MTKHQHKTKITFSKNDMGNHRAVDQVYGMEFHYNNKPLSINNFELGCLYNLTSRIGSIFNGQHVLDDENIAEINKIDVWLDLGHDPNRHTLHDYCFYDAGDCMGAARSFRHVFKLFGSAQYFYRNPICTNDHLIEWIEIFLKAYFYRLDGYSYSSNNNPNVISWRIEQISKMPNAEEIFNKLYAMANQYCAKIYHASLKLLDASDQHIEFGQIQTRMVVKKIQFVPTGSCQLDDVFELPNLLETVRDSKLISFLKTTPNSFNYVYKLNNLSAQELTDVKKQIAGSLDKSCYRVTKYYIAGNTDDIHLILKLLVPGKFESMENILALLRTYIR